MGKAAIDADEKKKDQIIEFEFDDVYHKEIIKGRLSILNMTPVEVRDALNEVPARYSYWASLKVDIVDRIDQLEHQYNLWFCREYFKVDSSNSDKTEGWKKNRVLVLNSEKVKKYYVKKRRLQFAKAKVSAIVSGYEMQSRTLQTVGSLLRAELKTYSDELPKDLSKD